MPVTVNPSVSTRSSPHATTRTPATSRAVARPPATSARSSTHCLRCGIGGGRLRYLRRRRRRSLRAIAGGDRRLHFRALTGEAVDREVPTELGDALADADHAKARAPARPGVEALPVVLDRDSQLVVVTRQRDAAGCGVRVLRDVRERFLDDA